MCLRVLVLMLVSFPTLAGDALLSWEAPVDRTDGSPLTNLAGFRIRYGTSLGNYPNVIDLRDPAARAWLVSDLYGGVTWYFVLSAYDSAGLESVNTSPVSKFVAFDVIVDLAISWSASSAPPTEPPMAFQQFASNQATTGAAVSAAFGSNVAVGDLVVVYAPSESGDINVTFSNSGTATLSAWTEVAGLNQTDVVDGYSQEVAYARVTGAGTLTVTATWASGQAWMAVAAMTFNEMPDPLVLQDSQYDAVTLTNPDGSDMTPTSQPAWVVGFGLRWGSPLQTPGADTAAGFTSAGAGCDYAGTNIVRAEYQRITSTAALDMEFTTTNSGKFYLNGLIFTEAAAGGGGSGGQLMMTGVGRRPRGQLIFLPGVRPGYIRDSQSGLVLREHLKRAA